jgi:hypothetical protein
MKIMSFSSRFPDEQSCRDYLKEQREKQGIACKRCGCTKHYWLSEQEAWKCADCGSWTNLKAGTIMHKSKLPVRTWFECIHLMTAMKKSISALEMQKQLAIKHSYQPVWYMMQKIRIAMGKRDKNYQLSGEIEVDDSFFKIVDLELGDEPDNNTGRGSKRQQKVLVMVESTPNPKQVNPHKKDRIMGFVKMVAMDDLTAIGINYEIQKSIKPTAHIITDGYRGYASSSEVVSHTAMIVPGKEAIKKLPWVHTMISNAKRVLRGTHHSIGKNYMQNYLNEFTYKLNRRTFSTDLFDRMITCGVAGTWF